MGTDLLKDTVVSLICQSLRRINYSKQSTFQLILPVQSTLLGVMPPVSPLFEFHSM